MRMRNVITTGTMALSAFQVYRRYRARSGGSGSTAPKGRRR
ncbi:MAG: hypothetical protein JWM86_121 [Thermoleophilia bacterium]|nr:hypothetical protein [Thermoleophilia bacterium]